jgi:hypothetical protein
MSFSAPDPVICRFDGQASGLREVLRQAASRDRRLQGSLLPDTMPTECATVAHSTHHSNTGDMPMKTILVASLSLALIFAVAALVRQVRLRRALQSLLCRLMKHWKEGEHD